MMFCIQVGASMFPKNIYHTRRCFMSVINQISYLFMPLFFVMATG